ncbi:hypothetical protein [Paraburkholderia sp. BL6669N2]|uniref:hypothetical protein n=1 Tax=Paraburkholderia sp. BL6669N2 TaxID=1938807 RepID=UPI0011C0552B|nr:hypothetical protein [Paraburkholderia sp. BL6669N2]
MADLPVDATALGLNGVAATFDGHPDPGRRFIVQGMPTGFFYRSKRLDWRGLEAQGIRSRVSRPHQRSFGRAKRPTPRASLRPMEQIWAKVRPIEKN